MNEESNINPSPETTEVVPQANAETQVASPDQKYDWFKSELAGLNNNLADLYNQGYTPETQFMDGVDDYWSDKDIRAPFEQNFGEKAKDEFTKFYKASEEKLNAYKKHAFDITAASMPVEPFRSRISTRLEDAGKTMISKAPAEQFIKFPEYIDPWGRTVSEYNLVTGGYKLSEPKFGWREGVNKVLDPKTNEFVDLEQYKENNPGVNLVYAANEDGSPKLGRDNLAYVRPLDYGEPKKTYEQYYTDTATIMGSKGLERSDWYALQWLPKNTMNFLADGIDSFAELLKMTDNLFQTEDQSSWDKALTEYLQNDVNSVLHVPTSEEGMSKWYSTEGIADGLAQFAGQLFGMKGVGYATKTLVALSKMGSGQRAGQVASKLWMASLVSDDVAKEGYENGLTPKEIAAAYGLYTGMMYKIAGISEMVVNPASARAVQIQALKPMYQELGKVKQLAKGKVSLPAMYQAAKNAAYKVDSGITSLLTSKAVTPQLLGAGLAEGGEEVTEVFADKIFKEGYNAIWGPYAGKDVYDELTNKKKDARFKVSWDELPSEIAAAFTLGALGGGLYKTMDLFSNNSPQKRTTLLGYGAIDPTYAGMRKRLEKDWANDRILPGGKTIDIFGEKTDDVKKSRAYIAYQAIKNEIDMAQSLWKQYKADQSYYTNELALAVVNQNYQKITGEEADLRATSLGSDIATRLNKIAELQFQNIDTKTTITPEQAEKNNQDIFKLQEELKDITSGKNAATYFHESVYNVDPILGFNPSLYFSSAEDVIFPERSRLSFKEFLVLNEQFKNRLKDISQLRSTLEGIDIDQAIQQGIKIAKDSDEYFRLTNEINSKYDVDGVAPSGDNLKKKNEEVAKLDSIVYAESTNPFDDFEYTFGVDGKRSAKFQDVIKELNKLNKVSESGNIVFDDVAQIDSIINSVLKRRQQLRGLSIINPKVNQSLAIANLKADNPTITVEEAAKVEDKLNGFLGELYDLHKIASNNKQDPYKASLVAADKQRTFTAKIVSRIHNYFSIKPEYKDLSNSLSEDVTLLVGVTEQIDFETILARIQDKIHNYFKSSPNDAIDTIFVDTRVSFVSDTQSELAKEDQLSYNDFTYLKAIISFEPASFRSRYADALAEMAKSDVKSNKVSQPTKDMRTPFPAQERNIYRVASFLTGAKSTASLKYREPSIESGSTESPSVAVFTESMFLQDEQGSGKSLASLMGVKIAQLQRGGKVAIFAKNDEIRKKLYIEATQKLGIKVDAKVDSRTSWDFNQIKGYLEENKGENLKTVKYIIIDEATLYSVEELEKIDTIVRNINTINSSKDPIRILLVGDPGQTGAMAKDPEDNLEVQYNIGQERHHIERSEMTKFSWRTGNQDILDASKQLRKRSKRPNDQGAYITDVLVSYNKKDKRGFLASDNFDTDFKSFKSGLSDSQYFVITNNADKKAKFVKDGVPAANVLSPEEVQGQERDFVFVDIDIDENALGEQANMQYKKVLTAVGRARQMVVIRNHPTFNIKSVEGQSNFKDFAFNDEQLNKLRENKLKALQLSGVSNLEPAKEILDVEVIIPQIKEVYEINTKDLSSEEVDAWVKFATSLRPITGEKIYLNSFYTNGYSVNEDGSLNNLSVDVLTEIKRNLTDANKALAFGADSLRFVLQYQANERPSLVVDTFSETQSKGKQEAPKFVLYASYLKNGKEVANIAFAALTGLGDIKLPFENGKRVLSLTYNDAKSQEILSQLRANRQEAAIDITSPFKETRKQEKSKEELALDTQSMSVVDLMKLHRGHSYASEPWQVTSLGSEKTPYLFYSYVKTQSEIDGILKTQQFSESFAESQTTPKEGFYPTKREILNTSLEMLRNNFQILAIPLNGGKHTPVDVYLKDLVEKWKTRESRPVMSDAAKNRVLEFIASQLNLTDVDTNDKDYLKFNGRVANQLNKKKFTDKYKLYLLKTVRDHFELTEKVKEKKTDKKSRKTQKKKSKESKRVKDEAVEVKALEQKFLLQTFLKKVYQDSIKSANSEYAQKFVDALNTTVFPYGVYSTTETVLNSTDPRDTQFGQALLNYGYFSVRGAISPGYPMFKIPSSVFNSREVLKAEEIEIKKSEVAVVPDAPKEPTINSITVPKTETGQSIGEFFEERNNSKEIVNNRKIFDIANTWFKGQPNQYYFEEFIKYFSSKIANTVFPTVGEEATGIVTSTNINAVVQEIKRQLKVKSDDIQKILSAQAGAIDLKSLTTSFLRTTTNNNSSVNRQFYYDLVLSYEMDSLLKHFFPSIQYDPATKQYAFVNNHFTFNPIGESKDEVSHLATGSDFAKLILFSTPFIQLQPGTATKPVYTSSRTLNKEDYAMIIRDMKDNDITSLPKAMAYFKTETLNTRKNAVKFSIYQRLFAATPLDVNGEKHFSILAASQRDVKTTEVSETPEHKALRVKQAANGVDALLSFLASGNEAEYSRVIFNRDKSFDTTGRITNITANYFRVDLEQAIDAKKRTEQIEKERLGDKFEPIATYNPSKLEVTYKIPYGKKKVTIVVKGGANPSINIPGIQGAVDTGIISVLLNNLGMMKIKSKFIDEIPKTNQLIPVLYGIGKFLGTDSSDFFNGADLTEWVNFAETLQSFTEIESAYQYKLLSGERVNLLSLSYPYVRTNQAIREIRGNAEATTSPLRQLDIVKDFETAQGPSRLKISGYMLKEGFINEDETFLKHNSRLSDKEHLEYDMFHLYLGFMARSKPGAEQTAVFSPISFSDKGSAGVTKYLGNFLPRTQIGNKVDIEFLKQRTLTSVNNYYRELGISIIESWRKALLPYGIALPIATPIFKSPSSITSALQKLNKLIPTLPVNVRQGLLNSGLQNELHYKAADIEVVNSETREVKVVKAITSGIKNSIIQSIDPVSLERSYNENLRIFQENIGFFGIDENANLPYVDELKISNQEAIESYFWNWNWTSHNFNKFWFGPEEGYKSRKEYTDLVKRASQVSTNRMRFITRDENYESLPEGLKLVEGRKLGKFSQTAIIQDFKRKILPISYTKEVSQEIFNGAAFFNNFSKLQMKSSYGENFGMNVGANLKPISTSMNLETGMPRYDKYAAYEITEQMRTSGDSFVRALDRLMKDSIKYDANGVTGIVVNGKAVNSLFELENAAKEVGMTDDQIMDFMVQNKLQDLYIKEIIFDSSVKNGVSNLNIFDSFDALVNARAITSLPRANSEFGLVLDATHESNDAKARLSSQAVSAILQRPETEAEAVNIVRAIETIGNRARKEILESDFFGAIRDKINERGSVGLIQEIVNSQFDLLPSESVKEGKNPLMSNKIMLSMAYSALASSLSDRTIRFDIFGGQQVLAPATGVWQVIDDNGITRIATDKDDRSKARELNGFDAVKNGVSIKTMDVWLRLKQVVDERINTEDLIRKAELRRVEDQYRESLFRELASGGWTVQKPEVILSPTHFKAFGINPGTNLEDITPALFKQLDKEKRIRKFNAGKITNPALRAKYDQAKESGNQNEIDLIINTIVSADVAERENAGVYADKFANFQKTLDLVVGRIPGTTLHSITGVRVVGFAHNADNTMYVHPDILVFHGADQDIDKGNLIAYEAEDGKINIPTFDGTTWSLNGQVVKEDDLTEVQLKNFIASQFIAALEKAESAVVATMPTATDNLDEALESIPEEDASITTRNPFANNKLFVRGQGGKTSVGIGAVGMKTYSGMIFSARKRGVDYGFYTPVSAALQLGGRPATISSDLNALITYDEVIQAAVDNAKDPKLGRAGINEFDGGLVNTLALHGYSAQQIVQFLRNPIVSGIYTDFAKTKDFKTVGKRPKLAELIQLSPFKDTVELQDLAYFDSLSEELRHVGTILSINQEIPNNMYSAFALKSAFRELTKGDVELADFISSEPEEQEEVASQFEGRINIYQILLDNKHILSYLKSFVDMDAKMMSQSSLYSDITTAYQNIGEDIIKSEDIFNSFVDFVYGFGIDSFFKSRGEGAKIVMGGEVYDLSKIFTDNTSKGRVSFMRNFPIYFKSLQAKYDPSNNGRSNFSNNLQEYLVQIPYKDTLVLKPISNFRDYSAEKKAVVNGLMSDINNQFDIPAGDTTDLNSLMQFYSLIKDKGASTATSFVDMFTYNGSIFQKFDVWIQQNSIRNSSEYFDDRNAESLKTLFKLAAYNVYLSKEERKNEDLVEKKQEMKENSLFIPYGNSITLNDIAKASDFKDDSSSESFETIPEGYRRAIGFGPQKLIPIPGYKKKKAQKNFQDTIVRKAVGRNVSAKLLNSFASKMAAVFGLNVQVLTTNQIAENPDFEAEDATRKGFVKDGVIYINSDLATMDTPIHEFVHIWMAALKTQDKNLYKQIIDMSLAHEYSKTIRERYPEEDDEGIAEETFATLTGLYTSEKAFSDYNKSFFARMKSVFDRFINWVKTTFSNIFGVGISVNDSLSEIIDRFGESMMSAMDMSRNDAADLSLLGIRLVSADSELSMLREKLRLQNRYKKIC